MTRIVKSVSCNDQILLSFSSHCVNKEKLPPVNGVWRIIYGHFTLCPRCADKIAALLEAYDRDHLLGELHLLIGGAVYS